MKKAFTLIEVMVVMAIISILAGMITPMVWNLWDGQSESITKQRLLDLKQAMVGDRTLVQNGVRTNYGFVGDNGELPFGNSTTFGGLKYLDVNTNSVYPRWSGPYLKGGTDRTVYNFDAWGRKLVYTPHQIPVGDPNRYVYAEIRSYGSNGVPNDSDDIVIYVDFSETTPTNKLRGKIPSNLVQSQKYWVSTELEYADPTVGGSGLQTTFAKGINADCRALEANQSTYSSVHFQALPVGKIRYRTNIYSSSQCETKLISTLESYYFIQDLSKELLLDFHP